MSEPSMLDKTFNIIMKRMVESGQAPHYTEIAAELSLSMEEGRKPLHDLVDLFSVKHFTKRLDPNCFSSGLYMDSFLEAVTQLGKKRTFWSP